MTNGSPGPAGKVKTVSLHVGSTADIACNQDLTTAYVGKPFYCCVEWTADPPDDTVPFEYVYDEFKEGEWQPISEIGEFSATPKHVHQSIGWWDSGEHTIQIRMRRKDVGDDWHASNFCIAKIGKVENVTAQNAACTNEEVTFTVNTNPVDYHPGVVWKIDGEVVQTGTQTLQKSWNTTGTQTVTACLGDSCASKTIEIIDGLTVVPREAYVPINGTKDFEAWICDESGNAVPKTSADGVKWKAKPGRGNFTDDTYNAPAGPSSQEGSDWVKATYDKKDSYSTLTIFKVEITSVTPPNDNVSFTTLDAENDISCQADIKPDDLDLTYNSKIEWEMEDDPGVTGDSGNPDVSQKGNNVTLAVTAPAATSGRDFKLNYRIRASLTINGSTCYSAWEAIIQDDKDQLRQQYVDTGYSPIPARTSSALKNSSTYVNPGNLTFSEAQCNGASYCGNHEYLLDNTLSSVFQDVRDELGSPIYVTSAYRCPRWNIHEGGTANSRHTQGNAFDFDNGEAQENWAVAQAAKAAGVATTKILLYPQSGGGTYKTLSWLESNGYNDTNLPPGWTTYRFGHITTD
jgi:hypothetical protein